MTTPNNPLTTLGFINAGHFFTHLFMLLYATVILSFDGVMALSYGNLLSLALPGFILFGAGALPAGWLGDRWSARGMMALFFFGAGLSSVATGLARSPGEIAAGLCAIGLFCSIYHPVGTAWLIRVARRRGRALGSNGVFGNMGIAFAATVAGSLATLIHWRAAFIVPGVLSILIGAGFLLMVRSERGASLGPSKKYGHQPVPAGMWRVFAVLAVTALFGGIVFQCTAVALPKLFDDRLGCSARRRCAARAVSHPRRGLSGTGRRRLGPKARAGIRCCVRQNRLGRHRKRSFWLNSSPFPLPVESLA